MDNRQDPNISQLREDKTNKPNIEGLIPTQSDDKDYLSSVEFANNTKLGICEVNGNSSSRRQEDAVAFESGPSSKLFAEMTDLDQAEIMKSTFANLQEQFSNTQAGSCACVATGWVNNNKATVSTSYVGDSVAFMIVVAGDGTLKHALACNPELHDAYNDSEVKAIQQGVGRKPGMVYQGRLMGTLAVTRAFGDSSLNDCGLSHEPQTTRTEINNIESADKVYMVVTCDGAMEHIKGDNVAYKCANEFGELFVKALKTENNITPAKLSEIIVSNGLKKRSRDNITAMVFELSSQGPATGAVFDGHGGSEVAVKLSEDFTQEFTRVIINKQPEITLTNITTENTVAEDETEDQENVNQGIAQNTLTTHSFLAKNQHPTRTDFTSVLTLCEDDINPTATHSTLEDSDDHFDIGGDVDEQAVVINDVSTNDVPPTEESAATHNEVVQTSFIKSPMYDQIKAKLNELGWTVPVIDRGMAQETYVVVTKFTEKIKIEANQFTTHSTNVETFKAMLAGFKAACPHKQPRVTISDVNLQAAWVAAYQSVYSTDNVPANFIRNTSSLDAGNLRPTFSR